MSLDLNSNHLFNYYLHMSESISILHNMARSGGTLISRCIGCMQGVALLSEVHPFTTSGQFNPLQQANDWLDIDVQSELDAISRSKGISWIEAIELIHRCIKAQGRRLVVRDWSHLDFTGVPWVDPRYKMTTAELLGQHFEIHQAFTVRHPIDQWISLSKLQIISGKLDVSKFMLGYRAFAEIAADTDFIRYEDFTKEPESRIKQLSSNLAIEYDDLFMLKWSSFDKITGDLPQLGAGRATQKTQITPLDPKTPSPDLLLEFDKCVDFEPSLEILGYSNDH